MAPKQKMVGKLLDILVMRDDDLVPVLLRALVENDQQHVARELGYKGLYTFVVLLILYSSLIK